MRRRLAVAAGMSALWITLVLVGGWPDVRATVALLTGSRVTAATESALVTLLCWVAVVLLTVTLARSVVPSRLASTTRVHQWPAAILLVGAALLVAGIAGRGGYHVCCATPASAQRADQLVH